MIQFNGKFAEQAEKNFRDLLEPLVGRTIEAIIVEREPSTNWEDWIVLVLDNGTQVMLMQDPEGNGPGFPQVTPRDPTG